MPAPTATSAPLPPTAGATADAGTPAPGVADQDLVRAVGVLEQIRGHLLAAQELSAGGAADQAAEQAAIPAQELLDVVSRDLAAHAMDAPLRAALDAYAVAVKQGGPAAQVAQTAALGQIDAAEQALAGPDELGDLTFRVAVLRSLLEKVEEEYGESLKDGKVAELEPYQSAYGILQAARTEMQQTATEAPADRKADIAAAVAAADQLHAALPAPLPPAAPVAAPVIEQRVDAAVAALDRVAGLAGTAPQGGTLLDTTRAAVRDALTLYKAGQADAAYEKAASAYLDGFEKLEPDLAKRDSDLVPALETDFKALRDGIKAGRPQADLEVIAARIEAGLTRAADLLAK